MSYATISISYIIETKCSRCGRIDRHATIEDCDEFVERHRRICKGPHPEWESYS